MVVDDDCQSGVCQGGDDGFEDVQPALALEVGVCGEKVRGDERVREDELVAVGQADGVEAH